MGEDLVPLSKDIVDNIQGGTIYYQIASGGGGYENPKERDIDKVVADVKNEVCSFEKAREDYGVVFEDKEGFKVNKEETDKLRERH